MELWRHEPPNLSGFVKDHNSKIGAVVRGLTREESGLRDRLQGCTKRSAIMQRCLDSQMFSDDQGTRVKPSTEHGRPAPRGPDAATRLCSAAPRPGTFDIDGPGSSATM
ncbi:hypothetical protein GCM10010399_77210 [Dactylosporangium fulvum]